MKITAIGGDIAYHGRGKFLIRDPATKEIKSRSLSRIGMIAAGSGIAPMY